MKLFIASLALLLSFCFCARATDPHDLHFNALPTRWDEAIPLGNGMIGALVWQRADRLRFSLDRADLWDLRPMKGLHRKEFSYDWIIGQVKSKDYKPVQQYFDQPYDEEPAPSKIPGAALEFNTEGWGAVQSANLNIKTGICEVKWANGATLHTFVHAREPVGWFRFTNIDSGLQLSLIAPAYQGKISHAGDPVGGDDLSRLGYEQGSISRTEFSTTYIQKGWGGFSYEVVVRWKRTGRNGITGVWSISSRFLNQKSGLDASVIASRDLGKGFEHAIASHINWWKIFWSKSALSVPDSLLEKQWYLEQYKFGSTARRGAPPISLQAVWTADNGRLPPWKGDFHNDLNTQLSYWPAYSGNHLNEAMSFLDFQEKCKANYLRYTKLFFKKEGLAVPGVTTLDGTEMGGWIQYSLSPTVSCWLAQHYYLQWKYSMDKKFLADKAYPWIKSTARFIENLTVQDEQGFRKLPMSTSPEINDNDLSAWFEQNTNYDLSLMKFIFSAASETARELGFLSESNHWKKILSQFPGFALTAHQELMFAPSMAYNQSHRHFSNLMSIYPLGLIKWEDGEEAKSIISHSIKMVDSIGPALWCGYSYSWLASLKARAKDGAGAVKDLQIFAKAFCSVNSFHLNGDQTKSGFSTFEYRPFTLEGNFAFASGLQEMLLQSYAGFIEIFPAVPDYWDDISFRQLRAEGAFLVSARKLRGRITELTIESEKGGTTILKLPFAQWNIGIKKNMEINQTRQGFLRLECKPGSLLQLVAKPLPAS